MPIRVAAHTFNWIPWADTRKVTLDLERVFEEIREAGYDAVEFSRHPMEMSDPARTGRLLKEYGLTLSGMSFYYNGLPGLWAELVRDARILAGWGATKLVLFDAADWSKPPADVASRVRNSAEAAEAMAEDVAPLGLDVVFHNHLHTNLETPAQMDALLPKLRRSGFCLDTGHVVAAKGDPSAFIRRYAGILRHVHLKDVEFKPDGSFADFGELGAGKHAFKPSDWLETLRAVNYDGWLVAEQDRTKTTPLASARANREWLRRHGV